MLTAPMLTASSPTAPTALATEISARVPINADGLDKDAIQSLTKFPLYPHMDNPVDCNSKGIRGTECGDALYRKIGEHRVRLPPWIVSLRRGLERHSHRGSQFLFPGNTCLFLHLELRISL